MEEEHIKEIEELFRAVLGQKVQRDSLEVSNWEELFRSSKSRNLDLKWATKLYKWWLGRKYWLVEQKTEQKYNPNIIIF